jgi:predicted DNA-binding transcriptional regulator AlpA
MNTNTPSQAVRQSHKTPGALPIAAGVSLLRLPAVLPRLGIGKTTFYRWIKEGTMPPGITLGTCDTAPCVWPSDEVDTMVGAIIEGQSDDERRATVANLLAARRARVRAAHNA